MRTADPTLVALPQVLATICSGIIRTSLLLHLQHFDLATRASRPVSLATLLSAGLQALSAHTMHVLRLFRVVLALLVYAYNTQVNVIDLQLDSLERCPLPSFPKSSNRLTNSARVLTEAA